ncbi:hypothetical protein AMATHDRAFT_138608 [Amanita thiersii Skay4041]|uniref:Mediator of RNA polymerase II transcription subunit 19 n=1 Tax=Amanita thiersii Skay4041 TaxID=703135 RepID=A0A2A9NX70_9AGAR|nr:hypothetical protein AMATHDRAFT_138608 [Amanita thiersii Skay4041]
MNGDSFNAQAGPSNPHNYVAPVAPPTSAFSLPTLSESSSIPSARPPPAPSIPSLYLTPPGPPSPPTLLASTQDLISRFGLLPSYDKYVRPYALHPSQTLSSTAIGSTSGSFGGIDKGKGREVVADGPGGMGVPVLGGAGVAGAGEEEVKGERKKKNTYKHLIKGTPGKHSMKKDDYLSTMMLVPPKQRIQIRPFDARTQRDAFTVSLEGLKGWNIHALVLESPQAREDRKKRKELKRMAKAQVAAAAAALQAGLPLPGQAQPIHAPVATHASARPPAAASAASPNGIATPRPTGASTPRPRGSTPRPASTIPRPAATSTTATAGTTVAPAPVKAQPQAIPRPGSTKPIASSVPTNAPAPTRPGSTVPMPGSVRVNTPVRTSTPMQVDQPRGKKRERDDMPVNGVPIGNVNGTVPGMNTVPRTAIDAKAGVAGVRPRPIKKQKMDRDVAPVQQQPTPQGV